MTMKDTELPWWDVFNIPNGRDCERNGCDNLATNAVSWARYDDYDPFRVCRYHANWWAAATQPAVVKELFV